MRTLRAFVWLRWRLVVNSLRGGRRRDTLEQISRALSMALPFAMLALAFGSLVGISIVGFVSGRALATGALGTESALAIARAVLFGLTITLIIFSVTSPVQGSLTHYSRLLLLPISRRTLHLVEVAASLADPWIAFLAPGLLLVAVGMSVGGRAVAAAWAALAAVMFLLVLAAMASLIGFLVAWLLKDRRRSEWFTLAFVIGMSAVGFVPLMMAEGSSRERREARRTGEARPSPSLAEIERSLPSWTRPVPSELYGRTVASALDGDTRATAAGVAALATEAALLFVASSVVHSRLIGATNVTSRRRRGAVVPVSMFRLPGLSDAVSAVAITQARTAIRSVRGRLLVFLSGPILAVLVFFFRRFPEVSLFSRLGEFGYVLAGASVVMAILSAQSFTMNLFASDRAGLTLQFLVPVGDVDLARGKIIGVGLVLAATAALAVIAALIVAPGGSAGLWCAALLGAAAVYLLISPVAVWMSALFPVASDLSRAGQGGNPHGLAGIAGMAALAASTAATGGLFWVTVWAFERPELALPVMAVWFSLVAAAAHVLVAVAARAVTFRRENLGLVAQNK